MKRVIVCDSGLGGLNIAARFFGENKTAEKCELIYINACPSPFYGFNKLSSDRKQEEVFRDVLEKQTLERNDLELIIDRIKVCEDHLDIQLKPDIDILLKCGLEGLAANFKSGIEDSSLTRVVQKAVHQKDKVFDVNVISEGDPLLKTLTVSDGYLWAMKMLHNRVIEP